MLSGNDVVDKRLCTAALRFAEGVGKDLVVVEGVGKGVVVLVNQSP